VCHYLISNDNNNNEDDNTNKASISHYSTFISLILYRYYRNTKMPANCLTKSFFLLSIVISLNIAQVFGQSNYASHGTNANYIGKGLPEETVLDGKVQYLIYNLYLILNMAAKALYKLNCHLTKK
jgi:hypothetical protein